MKELEFKNIIAYLIPGVIGLYGISRHSSTINILFTGGKGISEATAIVLIVLLSIGIGMIINAITWAVIRPTIELFGQKRPDLDYSKLNKDMLDSFKVIIEENYRYYQTYSNLLTALLIYSLSYIYKNSNWRGEIIILLILPNFILWFAARDSLGRSYKNMQLLLNQGKESENDKRNTETNPSPTA